jgi:hypothetical protein
MKNIHILSTDQPSRLWVNNLLQGKLELSEETLIGSLRNRYIYITSDKGIKEGDWFITKINDVFVLKVQEPEKFYDPIGEKIILTTDPTLIADGVQAIDDEFLEWFVKNSSCKFVEVINDTYTVGEMSKLPLGTRNHKYKLIIPQEEPKQYPMGGFAPGFYSCKCVNCKIEFTGDKRAVQCKPCAIKMTQEETKQDLKEAAEIYSKGKSSSSVFQEAHKRDFIEGANYQAKIMYSEEEVLELLKKAHFVEQNIEEWFEQFKKK